MHSALVTGPVIGVGSHGNPFRTLAMDVVQGFNSEGHDAVEVADTSPRQAHVQVGDTALLALLGNPLLTVTDVQPLNP